MDRIVIIEDEYLAAQKLAMLLEKINPSFEIMAVLQSVEESVTWLTVHKPDLIFLDIYLADDISFKIFDRIEIETPIIFTTAYDEYAIKAFQVNSLGYILKPIDEESLRLSLEKYFKHNNKLEQLKANLGALISIYRNKNDYKTRFSVNYGNKSKIISVNNIAFFFAKDKTVFLTTFDKVTYLVDTPLEKIIAELDPKLFYKINRKVIVHVKAIKEVYKFSARKLKLNTDPMPPFDIIIPTDNMTDFKKWINL
ncbi:MAG: LytTR family DNA-binding domain-containing protein [Bacteroidota bacterium]